MNGIVQSVTPKEGQYGKFSEVSIDGRAITAFKEFHNTAVTLAAGDSVDYTFEMKGKYPRFTSLSKTSSGSALQGPRPSTAVASSEAFYSKDESVLVSYAKDLMVSRQDMAPSQAVDAVFELLHHVKQGMKANPTS